MPFSYSICMYFSEADQFYCSCRYVIARYGIVRHVMIRYNIIRHDIIRIIIISNVKIRCKQLNNFKQFKLLIKVLVLRFILNVFLSKLTCNMSAIN